MLGALRSRGGRASRSDVPRRLNVAGRSVIRRIVLVAAGPATTKAGPAITVKSAGQYSVKGTVRKKNEDRADVQIFEAPAAGEPAVWAGVYDGHGGSTVAQWLEDKLLDVVLQNWRSGSSAEACLVNAYLAADKRLLASSGPFGFGERGVGGSKCGATSATTLLYQDPIGGTKLVTANVGDARILLIRDNEAVQLSEDHVPDSEKERERIEQFNPNPKLPMVRYVGGTWRVGGLLALSRAFGDAYLKGSLQFEGIALGSDNRYSSGFGLIAEPHTTLTTLNDKDTWLIVASDGLFAEEERGGGGGLDNTEVLRLCRAAGNNADLDKLAKQLADGAIKVGSTDDVTVIVMRLGRA